jgi:hypothetical protein
MKKQPIPMPVTLSDCYLLHQMGYEIEINDGRITKLVMRDKKKEEKNNG